VSGALARIVLYERRNRRCPASDFLKGLDCQTEKKFRGSFDALTKMGAQYCNYQRFRPLGGPGKPLWEFKEFDHRLYCYRHVTQDAISTVLLNGWVKEKEGKTDKEDREIEKAQDLYAEFLSEFPGGNI
jgi:hypothetical protein